MDWQAILISCISLALTALVSWGAERLIALINAKVANTKHAKLLTNAVEVITRSVKATYQTYVESLKSKDMFTPEAQKEALEKAGKTALTQMTDDVKKFITDNFGDVNEWVCSTIEAVIYDLKNKGTKVSADA